jgi:glucokinase
MEQYAIGIDIGGTTIKGAMVARTGRYRERIVVPTASARSGTELFDRILEIIASLIERKERTDDLCGVGIGTPGFVDQHGTIIGNAVNLPEWQGTNLYEPVMKRFGLRTVAANDATAMTLAEARFGAGRGVLNLVCMSLGTGIGGGIVSGGRLYQGVRGMAGEFGHVSIDPQGILCGCGQKGCVEQYASATGIVHRAQELCAAGAVEETGFVRMVRTAGEYLTAKQVYDFVNNGDPVALKVNEYVCDNLSRAIGIIISILAPDRVVLGGGVMMAGRVIIDTVLHRLPHYCLMDILKQCDIRAAELGEDAGVIGAGSLVFEGETHNG